jgi:hyaluronate lyase
MRSILSLRRRLAAIAAITALVGSAAVTTAPSASASEPFDAMRATWHAHLTGGDAYDPTDTQISARIDEIDETAQDWWDTMNTAPDRTHLWPDLTSTTNSSEVTSVYARLRSMALASATHGSSLEGSPALRAAIADALDWMTANRYNTTRATYGNWWDWEIGAPLALNDIVVLVFDALTPAQVSSAMATIDRFTPAVTMSAANRAWQAKIVALSGVLSEDPQKLIAARNGLSQTFGYVNIGDGFYRDGSFIQHGDIAYTGSYGRSLLVTLADVLSLLNGTPWRVVDPAVANVYAWVKQAFEPLVVDGAMMDMVRGREVTRHYHQDHAAGHSTIEAILSLARSAPAAEAAAYRAMVKEWILADTARDFFEFASITAIVRARQVVDDPSVVARGDLDAAVLFPNMDRAVAHREGWSFGLSLSSKRVALFESLNGENRSGWYTGAGMTYLYNADQQHYSDAYWPTVDPYRLPGTTVDVRTRAASSNNGERGSSDWVGGAGNGTNAVVGMDYKDVGSPLTAKKSWFLLDDEVVSLGAGITSTSGRTIESTVENRMLGAQGTNPVRVDGVAQPATPGWSATLPDVDRLHIAGSTSGADLGYYFPEPQTLKAARQSRTGTWSAVDTRPTTPTTPITRTYATFGIDHGVSPSNAGYAYALLPGASSAALDAYASAPDFEVLENSSSAQGIVEHDLDVSAANFWGTTAHTVGEITSSGQAAVLVTRLDTGYEVVVADPTQKQTGTIEIEIDRPAAAVESSDPRIQVTQLGDTVRLVVDVSGTDGRSLVVRLATAGAPSPWALVDEMGDYDAGWSAFGGSSVAAQGSGFVTVSDNSTTASRLIARDGFVPPAGAFTVEARMRMRSGTGGLAVRSGDYLIKLELTHGAGGVARDGGPGATKTTVVDTTIAHDYRLVVHADHTYDLYVDGAPAWAGAANKGSGNDALQFGLGAAPTGSFEVDAVRLTEGELVP